jgi:hypothetical protein
MAITINTDMIDVQILMDVVRGVFKGKNAFMGSVLTSQGAVRVNGTMPNRGQSAIGKKIDMPNFGTLGEFVSNPDGSSVTPSKLAQVMEQATIARHSLAAEVSRWAQGVGAIDPNVGDPYQEGARQIMAAATRAMDQIMITEMSTTPLVVDVYNANTPVYLDWDLVQNAMTLWGDDQEQIVGMALHSQSKADVATLKDGQGKLLLLVDQTQGQGSVTRFGGVPLVLSDRVALTDSTMTTPMGEVGTTPPDITLAGTPLGPWKLKIIITVGGASNGTAKFKFSVDGGNIYSAELTVPNGGGAFVLTDTATDSLVGVNGKTGITATFTNGTYNVDNIYKSIANLKVTDLICQQDAGGFWFNATALGLKNDEDILADTDITASHLYYAAKLYRRRREGSRPGVIAIKHNVKGYVGGTTF